MKKTCKKTTVLPEIRTAPPLQYVRASPMERNRGVPVLDFSLSVQAGGSFSVFDGSGGCVRIPIGPGSYIHFTSNEKRPPQ